MDMDWKIKINEIEHSVRYSPAPQSGDGSLYVDGVKIAKVNSRFRIAWVLSYSFEIDGHPVELRGYDHQYDLVYQGMCVKRRIPYNGLLFDWQSILTILVSLLAMPVFLVFPSSLYMIFSTLVITWRGLLFAFSPFRGKWRVPCGVLTCLAAWSVAWVLNI